MTEVIGPSPASNQSDAAFERKVTLRAVTLIMAAVVGLTFLFGFGNVWTLALRLGVPPWVAPLVAPAVDLSVVGLLLGTRYLALHGARPEHLRPARRLLVFSSVMTLALNVTDPVLADQFGKAGFDAVGPLLLIGWAEVGPGLLQAIGGAVTVRSVDHSALETEKSKNGAIPPAQVSDDNDPFGQLQSRGDDLLERAQQEDAWHWEMYQRPISAETLRKRLRVGAVRSRMLVAVLRSTTTDRRAIEASSVDSGLIDHRPPRHADGTRERPLNA
jgi:hypothetical protein